MSAPGRRRLSSLGSAACCGTDCNGRPACGASSTGAFSSGLIGPIAPRSGSSVPMLGLGARGRSRTRRSERHGRYRDHRSARRGRGPRPAARPGPREAGGGGDSNAARGNLTKLDRRRVGPGSRKAQRDLGPVGQGSSGGTCSYRSRLPKSTVTIVTGARRYTPGALGRLTAPTPASRQLRRGRWRDGRARLATRLRHEVDARPQPVPSALADEFHVFFRNGAAHHTTLARKAHKPFSCGRAYAESASSTCSTWVSGLTRRMTLRDVALRVDHERRAFDAHVGLAVHLALAPDAVALRHLVVRVGQQRERQAVLLLELHVRRLVVGADPEHDRPALTEGVVAIADPTGLRRASRRVVLGIEVDDDGLALGSRRGGRCRPSRS